MDSIHLYRVLVYSKAASASTLFRSEQGREVYMALSCNRRRLLYMLRILFHRMKKLPSNVTRTPEGGVVGRRATHTKENPEDSNHNFQ